MAFVTFDTRENAQFVKDRLHGGIMDDDSTIELRLEWAKSPQRNQSRKRPGAPLEFGRQKYMRNIPGKVTLKIFDLAVDTTEEEVVAVLKELSETGFMRHRWSPSKREGGTPIAFADFVSMETAMEAMKILEGHVLPSVPNGMKATLAEQPRIRGEMGQFGRSKQSGANNFDFMDPRMIDPRLLNPGSSYGGGFNSSYMHPPSGRNSSYGRGNGGGYGIGGYGNSGSGRSGESNFSQHDNYNPF